MYLLATSFQNDQYHLLDNIWNTKEFFKNKYLNRMTKYSLHFNIIELAEKGEYTICILKTFWLSIFQRKVRRRLLLR
jgi:hypothetical protein